MSDIFEYEIFFKFWEDIYDLEFSLHLAGVYFEFDSYCDRLYVYGDWEDADIAESLMRRHGIDYWEVY